MIPVGLQLDK